MKFSRLLLLQIILLLHSCANQKKERLMEIMTPKQVIKINDNSKTFSGFVAVQMLFKNSLSSDLSGAEVTFSPQARSAWHDHPKGQLLVVNEGEGYIQQWGQEARRIKKGDVIWTPPGIKHWHGACEDKSLSHLALQESVNGSPVNWMEKVTDREYNKVVNNFK